MASYRLGIDLGTTWCAAAIERDGVVTPLSLSGHETMMPSIVHISTDGVWTVGETALRRGAADPAGLAREFKRRIGDPTPVVLNGVEALPEELTARLLGAIAAEVSEREGGPPGSVTLTHPAQWTRTQQELLSRAVDDVFPGISHDLMSEPAAVAAHYASQERVSEGAVVAVYDFGGGTFDATVLRKGDLRFEILGEPAGLADVGGIDLDELVLSIIVNDLGEDWAGLDRSDPATRRSLERLRRDATAAKETLSADVTAVVTFDAPGIDRELQITRDEIESKFRPVVERTINALHSALDSAGVTSEEVTAVLLAGGSSRIPLVGEALASSIGRPIAVDIHPKLAVALGAATPPAEPQIPQMTDAVDAEVRSVTDLGPAAVVEQRVTDDREDAPAGPAAESGKRRRRGGLATVGLVIAGVALIASVVFLVTRNGGDSSADQVDPSTTVTTSPGAVADSIAPVATVPDSEVVAARELLNYVANAGRISAFIKASGAPLDNAEADGTIALSECRFALDFLEATFLRQDGTGLFPTVEFAEDILRIPDSDARAAFEGYVSATIAFYQGCLTDDIVNSDDLVSAFGPYCEVLREAQLATGVEPLPCASPEA